MTGAVVAQLRARKLPKPEVAKAIRLGAGATQEACAAELGVTRVTYARWEGGKRTPRGALREAYAKQLAELAREVAQ